MDLQLVVNGESTWFGFPAELDESMGYCSGLIVTASLHASSKIL